MSGYCSIPQWLSKYTIIITIIILSLITFGLNLLIFKFVHSSSRRIHHQQATMIPGSLIDRPQQQQQSTINPIDYDYRVSLLVYALFQILAVISLFISICDLIFCIENNESNMDVLTGNENDGIITVIYTSVKNIYQSVEMIIIDIR
ncbi:hypothetical protein I4U23_001260 [Adineta vaga]|nr:hypothetical protein I4U23_001260 [Adineta vaga]